MSITDELRRYISGPAKSGISHICEKAIANIADRIDAEHESACAEAYGNGVQSVGLPDMTAYVKLPVDADGEPIHIGDVMDSKVDYLFDGKPFTVRGLVLCEDGWEVTDGRFGNRYKPDSLRHHHEPTVEDVLREFLMRCETLVLGGYKDIPQETFNEYAAKLRLADDGEEQ